MSKKRTYYRKTYLSTSRKLTNLYLLKEKIVISLLPMRVLENIWKNFVILCMKLSYSVRVKDTKTFEERPFEKSYTEKQRTILVLFYISSVCFCAASSIRVRTDGPLSSTLNKLGRKHLFIFSSLSFYPKGAATYTQYKQESR